MWFTTLTAPRQRLVHTNPRSAACAILQRRITTLMSGRTPVPRSALHQHPHCAPTDHAQLPLSGLPSGPTQLQELPQTPLPEQPAAAQTPSPAAVSAPGVLPAMRPNLCALLLAGVPYSPPPASGQHLLPPAPATAS